MPILNYTTKVPVNRTVSQIQEKLAKGGAKGVLCEYDSSGLPDRITFSVDTPYGITYFKLPANIQGVSKALINDNTYKDENHARRVAWRILKDWIEAQLAIIEAGMAELEQVFLPYAQTDNGQTVYERIGQTGLLTRYGG
jgi:hypothetical protein